MAKRRFFPMNRYLLFLFLMTIFWNVSANDVLFVQSTKAVIFSSPNFKADTVAEIKKGEKVDLIETASHWVKISYQGKTGWVSKLLVSSHPPQHKITVINEHEDQQQKDNVRRRASATASAAAARGLRDQERARASDHDQPNWKALDKVDAVEVDETQVNDFIKNADPN